MLERRNYKKGDLIIIGTFVLFVIISTMFVLKAPTGPSGEFSGQVGDYSSQIQHITKNPPTSNFEHEGATQEKKENQHHYKEKPNLKKQTKQEKEIPQVLVKKVKTEEKKPKKAAVVNDGSRKLKKPKKIQRKPKKIAQEPTHEETDETDPFPEEN
jgi:hypothetical protein